MLTSCLRLQESGPIGQSCVATTIIRTFQNVWQWVGHKAAFGSAAPALSIPQVMCKIPVVLSQGATSRVCCPIILEARV